MKVAIFFLIIFTLITTAQTKEFDFRKAKWGMTENEVRASETGKFYTDIVNGFVYEDRIADMNAFVFYMFGSNKLAMASYMIDKEHSNKNDYISDFKTLKNLLIKKYGEPYLDKTIWKNNLYKNDLDDYGMAISVGHLVYTAKWSHIGTEIFLRLSGDNYKIMLGIDYTSKVYSDYLKIEVEKEHLEGL